MNVDIAKTIAALPGTAVLFGLLIVAALLVILVNWRLLIVALALQYVLVGLMLTRVVPIELAAVKALVGIMICPVLFITARRVQWGRPEKETDEDGVVAQRLQHHWWQILSAGWPVRVIVAVLALAISTSLAARSPLSIVTDVSLSRDLTTGAFSVMLLGLINAALAENPLKVGIGLLSILAGFELFYTAVEPTLTIVGLLGLTNLFLALAIAYLITAWASRRSEVPV
jgi:hypothetical protein